jgi:hypothetical protein
MTTEPQPTDEPTPARPGAVLLTLGVPLTVLGAVLALIAGSSDLAALAWPTLLVGLALLGGGIYRRLG